MADLGENRQSPHPLKRPSSSALDELDPSNQRNDGSIIDSDIKAPKRTRNISEVADEELFGGNLLNGSLGPTETERNESETLPVLAFGIESTIDHDGKAGSLLPGSSQSSSLDPDAEFRDIKPASFLLGGNADAADDEDSVSEISDLSDINEETWRPSAAGPMSWISRQISEGVNPRPILQHLIADDTVIPESVDDFTLWKIIVNIMSEPPPRKRLEAHHSLDHVLQLLKSCQKIIVLTGAGVSVSCGIPDFRSKDGIYSRLAVEYPDLPDPQAMFDIHYFVKNQKPFYKFAKEIYPGQFQPSPSHRFIQLLEEKNKLLCNYTQNIDTLEQVAGIHNVVQCHGSFATATCMTCKLKCEADDVKQDIMNQIIPRCPRCPPEEPLGIMKPDIVFFGESLPEHFHRKMDEDKDLCDLLIVMGSSLKVRPVALIPNSIPAHVPQILINREPLKHLNFDVELLGDCDAIVNELCLRMDSSWRQHCSTDVPMQQILRDELITPPPAPSLRSSANPSTASFGDDNSRMSFQNLASDDNNSRSSLQASCVDETSCMSVQEESSSSEQLKSVSFSTSTVTFSLNSPTKKDSFCNVDPLRASEMAPDTLKSSPECTPVAKSECSKELPECSKELNVNVGPSVSLVAPSLSPSTTSINSNVTQTPQEHTSKSKTNLSVDDKAMSDILPATPPCSPQESNQLQTPGANMRDEISTQLEELRACWRPRKISLAKRLPADSFLYVPPNRYVFVGAEVFEETESDDEESTTASMRRGISGYDSDDESVKSNQNTVSEHKHTLVTACQVHRSMEDTAGLGPDSQVMLTSIDPLPLTPVTTDEGEDSRPGDINSPEPASV